MRAAILEFLGEIGTIRRFNNRLKPLAERMKVSNGHADLRAVIYSPEDLEEALKMISARSYITSLDASENRFGPEHMGVLGENLGKTRLRNLNLHDNKIGGEGASILAQRLIKNGSNLRSLDLSNNKITARGGEQLAEMLKTDHKLHTLDLSENRIYLFNGSAKRFTQKLAEALVENTTLESVKFEPIPGWQISNVEKHIGMLEEAAESSTSLSKITFRRSSGGRSSGSWHSADIDRGEYVPGISVRGKGSSIRDVVRDYAAIISSRVIRNILAKTPEENFTNELLHRIEKNSTELTREILLEGLSHNQIREFSKYWHQPFRQVQSQKLRDYGNLPWATLTTEKETEVPENVVKGGWKLVCLQSSEELKKEGQNLSHCVGGYAGRCLSGESHIFSVVNESGKSVSTLELGLAGGRVQIKQHKGTQNSYPAHEASKAADWLVELLNNGTIPINYEGMRDRQSKEQSLHLESRLGFNPANDGSLREAISAFRDMLPPQKMISRLTQNFQNLLGAITVDSVVPEAEIGAIKMKSMLPADKTAEDNLRDKTQAAAQTSLNRIFGKKDGSNVVYASAIEDRLRISSSDSAVLKQLEEMLAGHFTRQKDGGLLVMGEKHLQATRKILTKKAFELRQEQEKVKQTLTSQEEPTKPGVAPRHPEVGARDDNDLDLRRP